MIWSEPEVWLWSRSTISLLLRQSVIANSEMLFQRIAVTANLVESNQQQKAAMEYVKRELHDERKTMQTRRPWRPVTITDVSITLATFFLSGTTPGKKFRDNNREVNSEVKINNKNNGQNNRSLQHYTLQNISINRGLKSLFYWIKVWSMSLDEVYSVTFLGSWNSCWCLHIKTMIAFQRWFKFCTVRPRLWSPHF